MSSIHETVLTLWSRAEEHLTVAELDDIAGSVEEASMLAQNIATTCDQLAALAAEEEDAGPGWLCDPKSRAAMLWSIAAQASTIDALVTVGTRARARADDLLGWTIDAQISARKRLEAAQSDGKDATPKPRRRPPKE